MFMHGSLMHIAFNMCALWMFGKVLEQVWGPKKIANLLYDNRLRCSFLTLIGYAFSNSSSIKKDIHT